MIHNHVRKKSLALVMGAATLAGASTIASADLTAFSRANCGNNESISWHAPSAQPLWVTSRHYLWGIFKHCITSRGSSCSLPPIAGLANTRRAAAVHWGEEPAGNAWAVAGAHYRTNSWGQWYLWVQTYATGCNATHW